jgi:hypothetical protein
MRPLWFVLAVVACSRETALKQACEEREQPDACEVLAARYAYGDGVPKDGARAVDYATRASEICKRPGADRAKCALVRTTSAIPVDPPPASVSSPTLSIVLFADGRTTADGAAVSNDDALRALARSRVAASADMRAVISADKDVPHGRVVQVLEALKQSGITKIAFSVSP